MTNLLRRRRFLRWGWRCVGFGKTHWQPRRAHPETADPHSWWGKDWRHAQHLHIHTKSGNAFITGANFLFCRVKTSPFRSIRNWWRIICAGRTVAPPLRHQNHWCASLLCWMEDGDARGRKKERKKGSTLHTRGSGLLNARLNLNSEHVKAFRGFARESKGERPRSDGEGEKKWTRPKTDGESRWHMRGKIMNVKVRLQWEWNICHMCAGCNNILRNICKQLVAQNWDSGYFETPNIWGEPMHQSFIIYGCVFTKRLKVNEADHCRFFLHLFSLCLLFLAWQNIPAVTESCRYCSYRLRPYGPQPWAAWNAGH